MLSVIVPTRNRAELLGEFLQSLTRQSLGVSAFEVLVIDNGSSDTTKNVADEFRAKLTNLRYFFEPAPGLHAGRHRGLMEARGEVLLFADDDIEAFPTWLESIRATFDEPDVVMAGGNNVPLFLEEPPRWLRALWDRPTPDGGRALPALSILELEGGSRECSPLRVWGCNFAIRKSVLLEAGGFHPDGMPEQLKHLRGDGEIYVARFVERSKGKCVFHPGASVYHKVPRDRMTFAYFRNRGFNQGISDSYTMLREKGSADGSRRSVLFVRRLSRGWHRLRDWLSLDADGRRALHAQRSGYRDGFAFHQRTYLEDPELRAWVHKPTYFEA